MRDLLGQLPSTPQNQRVACARRAMASRSDSVYVAIPPRLPSTLASNPIRIAMYRRVSG